MNKLLYVLMLIAGISQAHAQATFTAKDAAGATQTFKSVNCSATICSIVVPVDSTGAPIWGIAGTANANILTVQGIASMTPILATLSGTNAVNASQSGTWTVQPGNTANTTAWLVTGTGGTFPATQSGAWNITNISGTVSLPTLASTSTKQSDGSQKTQIVDGSGNVIASTSNNLNVQCANCSGSGVSTADEATFTAGTSLFAGTGGFFQTTATSNALTNGQQGMLQLTANRAAFTNLRNAAGTEVGTSTTPLQVTVANTGANATAMLVTGTGGTFPVTGATSNASSAVATSSTNVPGVAYNYGFNGTTWDQLQVDGSKFLKTVISAALPAGANAIGTVSVPTWAGGTLGAMANYGTSPGAVLVPGTNAFVTNTVTVTGTGGTFPITGATSNASSAVATGSTNVPTVAYSYGFNGTTWDQLQVDASKFLKVTVAAALPAGTALVGKVGIDQTTPGTTNAVSLAQIGSTTVDGNSGNKSAGTQRVVLATDQPAMTNAQPANVTQVGGSSLALGSTTASASIPVVLASNQTAADPCMFQNKTNLAISQNGTSSVQLIALSGSTVIYVCSLSLVAAGATTVAITTGTGSACVTGNAAVIGSTTANIANSMSFAANGGMTLGNGGNTIAKGAASSELCMVLGTSVFVSGNLTYVQQ